MMRPVRNPIVGEEMRESVPSAERVYRVYSTSSC